MKRSILILALSLAACSMMARETFVDSDFSKTGVEEHIKKTGSFDGVLPQGAKADFPLWNESIVSSKKMEEGGKSFIRFKVDKLEQAILIRTPNAPMPWKRDITWNYNIGT
jgi:hypothetical protein